MNQAQTMAALSDAMRLKHYSWRTEKSYRGWIRRYIDWLRLRGWHFTTPEARMEAFLTGLAHQGDAAATQNQAFNAILFLYRVLLKQELRDVNALRAKRPAQVRYAPSREQVLALIDACEDIYGYSTRLVVRLLYGCGLRVSEPLNLRVKDVDVAHSRLTIRGAKGGKDRVVTVPCQLMADLVQQMKRARVTFDADAQAGLPLEIPGQLARRYPRSPFAWQWAWVFPSKTPCQHPRTAPTVRYRMHEANVQRCVKAAATTLELDTTVTPHCLRHAYATHVLDRGTNIRDLQEALGHVSLETTMGYVHAAAERVVSPLT
jgi:integron integrase